MKEQVSCARIVPAGIVFCGSRRSPDMLAPVRIPADTQQRLTRMLSNRGRAAIIIIIIIIYPIITAFIEQRRVVQK